MADYIISTRLALEGVIIPSGIRSDIRKRIADLGKTRVRLDNFEFKLPASKINEIRRRIEANFKTKQITFDLNNLKIKGSINKLSREIYEKLATKDIGLRNFKVTQSAINSIAKQIAAGLNAKGISLASFVIGKPELPRANYRTVSKGFSDAKSRANDFNKQLNISTDAFRNFGRQAGITLRRFAAYTIVRDTFFTIENAIREAAHSLIDFDKQANRLSQTLKSSPKDVKVITNEIRSLSTNLGVSSNELANAAVQFAQAGIPLKEVKTLLKGLAQTDLSPSFESIEQTTEGIIALRNQFKLSADDVNKSLSSINSVAAAFAVESGDIVEAIRRSGGSFKAANGNLNELLATFTAVRQATRLSAPTIANAFNTILSRLQNSKVQDKLAEVGISLQDATKPAGELVKPLEQFIRLAQGIEKLNTQQKFQTLFEVAGQRQLNKIIPLLNNITVAQQAYGIAISKTDSLVLDSLTAQSRYETQLKKVDEQFKATFANFAENNNVQQFFTTITNAVGGLIKALDKLGPLAASIPLLFAIKQKGPISRVISGLSEGLRGSFSGGLFGGPIVDLAGSATGRAVTARQLVGLTRSTELFKDSYNANKKALLSHFGIGGFVGGINPKVSQQISTLGLADFGRAPGDEQLLKRVQIFNKLQAKQSALIEGRIDKNGNGILGLRSLAIARTNAITPGQRKVLDARINRLSEELQKTINNTNKVAKSMLKLSLEVERRTTVLGRLLGRFGLDANLPLRKNIGNAGKSLLSGGAKFLTGAIGASLASTLLLDSSLTNEVGDIVPNKNTRIGIRAAQGGIVGAGLGSFLGVPGAIAGGAIGSITSIVSSLKEIKQIEADKSFEKIGSSLSEILDKLSNASTAIERRGIVESGSADLASILNTTKEQSGGELFRKFIEKVQKESEANATPGASLFGKLPVGILGLRRLITTPEEAFRSSIKSVGSTQQLIKIRDFIAQSGLGGTPENQSLVLNKINPLIARGQVQAGIQQGTIKAADAESEFARHLIDLNEGFIAQTASIKDANLSLEKFSESLSDIAYIIERGNFFKDFTNQFSNSAAEVFNKLNSTLGEKTDLKFTDKLSRESVLSNPEQSIRAAKTIGLLTGNTDLSNEFEGLQKFRSNFFNSLNQNSLKLSSTTDIEEFSKSIQQLFNQSSRGLTLPAGFLENSEKIIEGGLKDLMDNVLSGNITGIVESFEKGFRENTVEAIDALGKTLEQNIKTYSDLLKSDTEFRKKITEAELNSFDVLQKQQQFIKENSGARTGLSSSDVRSAAIRRRAIATGTNGTIEEIIANLRTQFARQKNLAAIVNNPELPFEKNDTLSQERRRISAQIGLVKTADNIERLTKALEDLKDGSSDVTDSIKNDLDKLHDERKNAREIGEKLFLDQDFSKSIASGNDFINSFRTFSKRGKRQTGFALDAFTNSLFGLSEEGRGGVVAALRARPQEKLPGTDVKAEDFLNTFFEKIAGFNEQEFQSKENELLKQLSTSSDDMVTATKALTELSTGFIQAISDASRIFGELIQKAGFVPLEGRKTGGVIGNGKRTFSGVDSQLIAAQPGEFVVRKSVAQKNLGFLRAMNDGVPGYAGGGVVSDNGLFGFLKGIGRFGKKIVNPFIHPVQTIKGVGSLFNRVGSGLGKFVAGNLRSNSFEDRQRLLDEAGQEIFGTLLAPLAGGIKSTGNIIAAPSGLPNPVTGKKATAADFSESLLDIGTFIAGSSPFKFSGINLALKAAKPLAGPLSKLGSKVANITNIPLKRPTSLSPKRIVDNIKNTESIEAFNRRFNNFIQNGNTSTLDSKTRINNLLKRPNADEFVLDLILGSASRKLAEIPSGIDVSSVGGLFSTTGLTTALKILPQKLFPSITDLKPTRKKIDFVKNIDNIEKIRAKRLKKYPNQADAINKQIDNIKNYLTNTTAYGANFGAQKIAGINFNSKNTPIGFSPEVGQYLVKRHELSHAYFYNIFRKLFGSKLPVESLKFIDELNAQLTGYRTLVRRGVLTKAEAVKKIKGSFVPSNYPYLNDELLKTRDVFLSHVESGDIKFNKGGIVPGSGNSDKVRAKLTPGEFVVNKKSASQNRQLLENINNGRSSSSNISFDVSKFAETVNRLDEAANKLSSIPSMIEVKIAPVSVSVTGLNLQNMITNEAIKTIAKEVFNKLTGEEIRKKLGRV